MAPNEPESGKENAEAEAVKNEQEQEAEVAAAAVVAVAAEAGAAGEEEGGIAEASENDVISGRGAAVNLNVGNRRFRHLCFQRKPEFDAASHAAKRRIATEIVTQTKATNGRFLKRKVNKGPWFEMTDEQALLKACQVMRDYQRPDRIASRGISGRKRHLGTEEAASPAVPSEPLPPIKENPFGVHDHDVLSGRGAFINGHVGNERFRKLCLERKSQFDSGNYAEKRTLANEVVSLTRSLDPPGRFLKRVTVVHDGEGKKTEHAVSVGVEGEWEELSDDKAIHKACQVMRDIARPDRQGDNKRSRKKKKVEKEDAAATEAATLAAAGMTILAGTTTEASAVEEAVAAAEEALDKALDSSPAPNKATTMAEV